MNLIKTKYCRVCGSTKLKKVVSLGYQHLQGYFLDDKYKYKKNNFLKKRFLTELILCNTEKDIKACGLLQLSITVPKKLLYSEYFYKSGVNQTMSNHLHSIANEIINFSKKKINILDIGCNDGTLLNFYPKSFLKFGIDPSNILSNVNKKFNFVNDFFPSNKLEKLLKNKKLDVITSIAMFYDLEDPNNFVQSIYKLLKKKGIWIFEMSYMPQMLKLNSYDTICHEHLEYYSLSVIKKLLEGNNMKIAKIKLNNSNGGSIRCYAVKKDNFEFGRINDKNKINILLKNELRLGLQTERPYNIFKKKIIQQRKKLKDLITKLKKKNKKIHVYGASTKGNTILQWCKIDNKLIDFAADRNPQKHGLKTLGTNIPIISEEVSRAMKPDYYLVLPWHFKKEFIKREKNFLKKGGRFIFPLPNVEIYKY